MESVDEGLEEAGNSFASEESEIAVEHIGIDKEEELILINDHV